MEQKDAKSSSFAGGGFLPLSYMETSVTCYIGVREINCFSSLCTDLVKVTVKPREN